MDIVYTLSNGYNGDELKYSLRSLSNIPHDRVFVVGGCPVWLKDVIHIPTRQRGTKYKNTTNNLITGCNDPRVSDNFIFMNDDFFILEPTNPEGLNLHNGTVKENIDAYFKKNKNEIPYIKGMKETYNLLRSKGIDPLCYELHIPFVFNKEKFLQMFEMEGVKEVLCLHKRTLYGNLYLSGGESMPDVKIFGKYGFNGKCGKFLSCSDDGFNLIQDFLAQKFPYKSKYEQ